MDDADEKTTTPPPKPDAKPGPIAWNWNTVIKLIVVIVPVLTGSTVIGDWRADGKKAQAVNESTKVADDRYDKVAATLIEHTAILKGALTSIANLSIEVARLRDRDTARRKRARAAPDTAKVQGAIDKAAETLKAIKEDSNKVAKALVPPPATLRKEPPAPAPPQAPQDAARTP